MYYLDQGLSNTAKMAKTCIAASTFGDAVASFEHDSFGLVTGTLEKLGPPRISYTSNA